MPRAARRPRCRARRCARSPRGRSAGAAARRARASRRRRGSGPSAGRSRARSRRSGAAAGRRARARRRAPRPRRAAAGTTRPGCRRRRRRSAGRAADSSAGSRKTTSWKRTASGPGAGSGTGVPGPPAPSSTTAGAPAGACTTDEQRPVGGEGERDGVRRGVERDARVERRAPRRPARGSPDAGAKAPLRRAARSAPATSARSSRHTLPGRAVEHGERAVGRGGERARVVELAGRPAQRARAVPGAQVEDEQAARHRGGEQPAAGRGQRPDAGGLRRRARVGRERRRPPPAPAARGVVRPEALARPSRPGTATSSSAASVARVDDGAAGQRDRAAAILARAITRSPGGSAKISTAGRSTSPRRRSSHTAAGSPAASARHSSRAQDDVGAGAVDVAHQQSSGRTGTGIGGGPVGGAPTPRTASRSGGSPGAQRTPSTRGSSRPLSGMRSRLAAGAGGHPQAGHELDAVGARDLGGEREPLDGDAERPAVARLGAGGRRRTRSRDRARPARAAAAARSRARPRPGERPATGR